GLPAGATASFSPASVTAGAGSTLTVNAGANTPPGTYSLLVTGNAASAYHGTTLSLTVTANAVPTCTDQPDVTTAQDAAKPLLLGCNDTDSGDTLTYSITSEPAHGNVSAPDSAGNVTYTSPQSLSGLGQGSHTLLVKATDPADNSSSASRTWLVDTVAPTGAMTAPTAPLTTLAHVVASSIAADSGSGVLNRDYRYRR